MRRGTNNLEDIQSLEQHTKHKELNSDQHLDEMLYCPDCGANFDGENIVYCPSCGYKI